MAALQTMPRYPILEPGPLSVRLAQEVEEGKINPRLAQMLAEAAAAKQYFAQAAAESDACMQMAAMSPAGAAEQPPQHAPPEPPSGMQFQQASAASAEQKRQLLVRRSELKTVKSGLEEQLRAAGSNNGHQPQGGRINLADLLLQVLAYAWRLTG